MYSYLHEVVADIKAKFLNEGVIVEIRFANEIVDLPFSIRSRTCSGLDHGGSLHIRQFLDAPLALDDVAHFQWQVSMLVFLANLKSRLKTRL